MGDLVCLPGISQCNANTSLFTFKESMLESCEIPFILVTKLKCLCWLNTFTFVFLNTCSPICFTVCFFPPEVHFNMCSCFFFSLGLLDKKVFKKNILLVLPLFHMCSFLKFMKSCFYTNLVHSLHSRAGDTGIVFVLHTYLKIFFSFI